ncbi:hypothetical protein JCM10295v2_007174 [Rhodotorula toruloides]
MLLVSELVPGTALQIWEDVREYRSATIYAVKTLHSAGITHGDLRPSNFILRHDRSVAIVDYGRASHDAEPEDLEAERLQFVRDMSDCRSENSDTIAPTSNI